MKLKKNTKMSEPRLVKKLTHNSRSDHFYKMYNIINSRSIKKSIIKSNK